MLAREWKIACPVNLWLDFQNLENQFAGVFGVGRSAEADADAAWAQSEAIQAQAESAQAVAEVNAEMVTMVMYVLAIVFILFIILWFLKT